MVEITPAYFCFNCSKSAISNPLSAASHFRSSDEWLFAQSSDSAWFLCLRLPVIFLRELEKGYEKDTKPEPIPR